ncbi:uncharacterized protein g0s2 [Xenopus tropicalis]|uniref:Uncharacterized protein g0s2 n=1 Tax=Xenopus tropicalis TaxID=8364 RepID=A0A8J0SZG9_XENTR|nr:uncharacterized protein g0s2 [Xenopus tropicalis]|eukprot:XP_012826654.1 PREDICTED: uncharacterized protein g0s2 [Xenopus tropicalis]
MLRRDLSPQGAGVGPLDKRLAKRLLCLPTVVRDQHMANRPWVGLQLLLRHMWGGTYWLKRTALWKMQQEKLVSIESSDPRATKPYTAVPDNYSFGLAIPSILTQYGNHPRTDPICQRDAEPETQQKNGENLRVGQCVSLFRSGHWAGGNSVQSFLWSGGHRGRGEKESSGSITSASSPNKTGGDL